MPSPLLATTAVTGPDGSRELLTAVAAGDPQAWEVVVRRYERLLLSVARRQGLAAEDAADAVQETWLRLLAHAATIRDPERLPGWLVVTATRQCIAARQRTGREALTGDLEDSAAEDSAAGEDLSDVEERLAAAARRTQLLRAVAALPARERLLVRLLLEPDPPSYSEISRRLGMPVGSIGPVRARALRRLREALEDAASPPLAAAA